MKFPVLIMGNDKGLDFCPDLRSLTTTNSKALKSGLLMHNRMLDSDGNVYTPISVTKEKQLRFSIFLNPIIQVKYDFADPPKSLPLSELKREVSLRVSQDEDYYSENGDVKKLQSLIQNADGFEQLIRILDWENSIWGI